MYTFLFVSPNGSIPLFEFAVCPDDETACRNAARLLDERPERRAVEVWTQDQQVCIVERDCAFA